MSAVLESRVGFISLAPFSDEYTEQVMACARQMHQESLVHRDMDFDADKLLAQLRSPSSNANMYFQIATLNGEVIAGLFGTVLAIYFGADLVAKDLAIFVKKEWRLSRAAFLLVRDFEKWAKSRGASKVMLSQSTGVNVAATGKFYELMGYDIMGVMAWKSMA